MNQREALEAELITEFELESLWRLTSISIPAIKDIRDNVERLREAELRRHRGWLAGLPDDQRARIVALSRSIINKIFHQIVCKLRRTSGVEGIYAADVARHLLGSSTLPREVKPAGSVPADENERG
jgi:glutamyl-tRNA reductase